MTDDQLKAILLHPAHPDRPSRADRRNASCLSAVTAAIHIPMSLRRLRARIVLCRQDDYPLPLTSESPLENRKYLFGATKKKHCEPV
jgi:hypothetical protein